MEALVLARGVCGTLWLAPLEAVVVAGLTIVGVAVVTPEQERIAREIAAELLREADQAVHAA